MLYPTSFSTCVTVKTFLQSVFLHNQPLANGVGIQYFRDSLCLHHQDWHSCLVYSYTHSCFQSPLSRPCKEHINTWQWGHTCICDAGYPLNFQWANNPRRLHFMVITKAENHIKRFPNTCESKIIETTVWNCIQSTHYRNALFSTECKHHDVLAELVFASSECINRSRLGARHQDHPWELCYDQHAVLWLVAMPWLPCLDETLCRGYT